MAECEQLTSVHGRLISREPDPNKMCWGTALSLTGRKLRLTTCGGRDIYRCDNHPGSGLLGSERGCEPAALEQTGQNQERLAEALLSSTPSVPVSHLTPRPACAGSPACHHAHMPVPAARPRPLGPAASLLHSLQTDVDPADLSSLAQPPSIKGPFFSLSFSKQGGSKRE